MQYILTQDEYESLLKRAHNIGQEHDEIILNLCIQVAEHMPVKEGGDPHGCIHGSADEHYCEGCPVSSVCTEPNKMWPE